MAYSEERGHSFEAQLRSLELSVVRKTSKKKPKGTGSYANVYEVMVHETVCAAKELHPLLMNETTKQAFLAECVQCSRILHPNVVQFLGIYYPSPDAQLPWLVMEMMYISLTGLIEKYKKEDFPFHVKLSILMDTCQGIQYLHSRNIIHRDLSSNNILLTKYLVAKVGDLGVAKVVSHDLDRHTQAPGTAAFMPPEALSANPVYGPSIDVFSLGCVCVHMVSLQWPAPLDRVTANNVVLSEIQRRELYFVNLANFPSLTHLVEQCLQNISEKRPAIGDVIKELKNVECDQHPHKGDGIIELFNCVNDLENMLYQKDQQLMAKDEQLVVKDQQLSQTVENVCLKDQQLKQKDEKLTQIVSEKDQELQIKDQKLIQIVRLKDQKLDQKDEQLIQNHQEISEKNKLLIQKDQQLRQKELEMLEVVNQYDKLVNQKDDQISEKNKQLKQSDQQLVQKDQEIIHKVEQEIHMSKEVKVAQNDQNVHKKGSLLCITVVALLLAVLYSVYLSELQLPTSTYKQQVDKLIQQNIQLEDDKWLKSTNKQLSDDNEQLKSTNKQLCDENKQQKTTNKQLEDDNEQLQSTKKQLDDDNKQLTMTNKQLGDSIEQLNSSNKIMSYVHVAPVTFRMNNFTEKMKGKQVWYSDPFFSFLRGYKMRLRVDAGGNGSGQGTHVSVFLHLMKGPYDDELRHWPLIGMFKVELLDQLNAGKYTLFIPFDSDNLSGFTDRVIESPWKANISHENILHSNYLKNDSLYFMISYKSFSASKQNDEQVAPVVFKMNNFTENMKSKQVWFSDPFYAFWRGNKMVFSIFNAVGNTDTSLFFTLISLNGSYDDELKQSGHWPIRGMFKVELLDQLYDGKYTLFIPFDSVANEWKVGSISRNVILDSNYLKHDNLFFMITYQSFSASQQNNEHLAPVTFRMNNFTEKMKNKLEWYSDPFFAFWRGYKMCLNVVASGYGKGKGTHVSIYLYLMEGPYDDKLEQSGLWPVRGTFKIELLDQLNDENHAHYITFDGISSDHSDRVKKQGRASSGRGKQQFKSHNTILGSNYLKHDSLYLMISYQNNT